MNNENEAGESFGVERLPQLVEALPVGVFILAGDGRAIYANQAAQALLGRGIADGDGASNLGERFAAYRAGTSDLYPNADMPIVRALAGERSTVDDMEIDRDGERVALEVTATPILDHDSRVAFAVAVFQDITERRHAQRALAALNAELEREVARRTADLGRTIDALERASRAKSVFLMNISHELRTPLHQIIGFTDLLTERLADERTRRLSEGAGSSGRELLEKVDALIELARADTQQPPEQAVEFDLHAAVTDVANSFGLTCDVPRHLGSVRGNEAGVRQILSDVCRASVADARISKAILTATSERLNGSPRLVLHIQAASLASRVDALSSIFGDVRRTAASPYQQQPLDLRLAVARTKARNLGGDIVVTTPEAVEVSLPFEA